MRRNAVVEKPEEMNSWFKQCKNKTGYTKKEVIPLAKSLARRGRVKTMGYYHCSFCNKYHLTHVEK